MALRTLGTNAATSLSAIMFSHDPAVLSMADLAAFNALCKSDKNTNNLLEPVLSREGMFRIPGKEVVRVSPGDYVAVDPATGWPIYISANAIANGPYTHT